MEIKTTTTKQLRSEVQFCEEMLNITFEGNLYNPDDVNPFLAEYLADAINLYNELSCEYEAYMGELD
jgi:hypothetical protein